MNPQDAQLDFPQASPQQASSGTPQQQVLERLRTAVNVLVTVNNSPSVDQLAAAIGFTLLLNKMGKHATAVFSGDVPSTIEFLKPDETLEKNTDSLRDFIVSLDKAKADKLRYKVEENVVKIFITPYKTSLTEQDLNFSQGDFNVDAIVALGITEREQLDQAIIAHGRILHDATVITVTAGNQSSSLGAINWQDSNAASLCEMLVGAGDALEPGLLDNQIATAYLTGIVAQTNRFKNDNTTPRIMTLAASLLAAGANQQLIAKELEQATEVPLSHEAPASEPEEPIATVAKPDGELSIDHSSDPVPHEPEEPEQEQEQPPMADTVPMQEDEEKTEPEPTQIAIDEHGNYNPGQTEEAPAPSEESRRMLPLPKPAPAINREVFGGDVHVTSAQQTEDGTNEPHVDPLGAQHGDRILDHSMSTLPPLQAEEPEDVAGPETTDEAIEAQPSTQSDSAVEPAPEVIAEAAPAEDNAPEPTSEQTNEPASEPEPAPEPEAAKPEREILTLPPAYDTDTLHSIEKTFNSPHIAKDPTSTLDDIEESVASPHLAVVDDARDAVQDAIAATPYDEEHPEPVQALNANPLMDPAGNEPTNDPVLASLGLNGNDPNATLPLAQPDAFKVPTLEELDKQVRESSISPLPPVHTDENKQPATESSDPVTAPTDGQNGQTPPPVPPPMFPVR